MREVAVFLWYVDRVCLAEGVCSVTKRGVNFTRCALEKLCLGRRGAAFLFPFAEKPQGNSSWDWVRLCGRADLRKICRHEFRLGCIWGVKRAAWIPMRIPLSCHVLQPPPPPPPCVFAWWLTVLTFDFQCGLQAPTGHQSSVSPNSEKRRERANPPDRRHGGKEWGKPAAAPQPQEGGEMARSREETWGGGAKTSVSVWCEGRGGICHRWALCTRLSHPSAGICHCEHLCVRNRKPGHQTQVFSWVKNPRIVILHQDLH